MNINGGDKPFEVFMNVGKAGSDVAAVSEALGRLISLILRLPSPLDEHERLEEVVDQLAGIGGGRSLGLRRQSGALAARRGGPGAARVPEAGRRRARTSRAPASSTRTSSSCPCPITDRPIGDLCPDCGQATFVPTEGCRKCYACGYSEC